MFHTADHLSSIFSNRSRDSLPSSIGASFADLQQRLNYFSPSHSFVTHPDNDPWIRRHLENRRMVSPPPPIRLSPSPQSSATQSNRARNDMSESDSDIEVVGHTPGLRKRPRLDDLH